MVVYRITNVSQNYSRCNAYESKKSGSTSAILGSLVMNCSTTRRHAVAYRKRQLLIERTLAQ